MTEATLITTGGGGLTSVYMIKNRDGQLRALKKCHSSTEEEIKILRQLQGHSGIVKLYDENCPQADNTLSHNSGSFVMEYIPLTLEHYLKENKVDMKMFISIGLQLCSAVAWCHDKRNRTDVDLSVLQTLARETVSPTPTSGNKLCCHNFTIPASRDGS